MGRYWTPDEVFLLEEMITAGYSYRGIAKLLGRTESAVWKKRVTEGIPGVRKTNLSARALARLLNVHRADVTRWVRRGWLRAHRRRGLWSISEQALLDFLENPQHWHVWDPERITEPGLREWALEIRHERYLTPKQVAARLHYSYQAVMAWIRDGLLPAVKSGRWYIPESALDGFVPPSERKLPTPTQRRAA